jgi:putative phage-type endonuclease
MLNIDRKNIRNIIKKNFLEKLYYDSEIELVINQIFDYALVFNKDLNDTDSKTYISKYVYKENDKNYFLTKKNITYKYPDDNLYNVINKKIEPTSTQWFHDIQYDDEYTEIIEKRVKIMDFLLNIEYPEQRSPEWFTMREGKITASDGGAVIGDSKYDPQWKFIHKKVFGAEFNSNKYCYHGKKYEEIATMIYQYRMNVIIKEFGLIGHPKYDFLGASPDGIVGLYKLDGIHKTKEIGKMLEIKCPLTRKIITEGEIKDNICPLYYWIQVQLQLECCDLDECDFWQCNIQEYTNRQEFIDDTDLQEPYRSKETGFEKGCVIQLIPMTKQVQENNYSSVIFDAAIFIYPPKIEMTPFECDIWIADTIANYKTVNYQKYIN